LSSGDGCRFSHDLALASSALAASKGGVCFDFTKGVCNRGETCRFSHELPAAGTQPSYEVATQTPLPSPPHRMFVLVGACLMSMLRRPGVKLWHPPRRRDSCTQS
jgi:hypothetical protein